MDIAFNYSGEPLGGVVHNCKLVAICSVFMILNFLLILYYADLLEKVSCIVVIYYTLLTDVF